jgi:hypothetical protein
LALAMALIRGLAGKLGAALILSGEDGTTAYGMVGRVVSSMQEL